MIITPNVKCEILCWEFLFANCRHYMVPDIIQNNIDNALVAQNGCKKAMEQYSWDGFAKRFLYILNNL